MTLRQHIEKTFAQPINHKKASELLDGMRIRLGYDYEKSKAIVNSVYPDLDFEALSEEIDSRSSSW